METREEKDFFINLWNESVYSRLGCGAPLYAMMLLALVFILCSCSTKSKIEYVDREVVRYETKIRHDTINNNIHDSIYHTVYQKGDTVYDTKYVEKTKWRERVTVRIDTLWRDSIRTEYKETAKEVVKYPKSYWYAVGFSVLFFIFAFIKLIKFLKWH